MKTIKNILILFSFSLFISACQPNNNDTAYKIKPKHKARLNIYKNVELTADLSKLSTNQKNMIKLLIQAAKIMDELFWLQAAGTNKSEFLSKIKNPKTRKFAEINYGPWDRLNNNAPFLLQTKAKPLGAFFYPANLKKQSFEQKELINKTSLYTLISRDDDDKLITVPYSQAYKEQLTRAATLLKQAAKLAEDKQFSHYLTLRAKALLSNNYQASDMAWMDMKHNPIDTIIGPIETYEDKLFGYKAAFEAYVLIKDQEWTKKLSKFAEHLPELQANLPVPYNLKKETPGLNADLNAYDAIYYAGHANAGSKTIAINLPNDEEVQLTKGTRRLQLKNAMRAKFDHILLPIAEHLIVPEQRKYITFNAFFANTMFHEVAHGLGIKNTINEKGTVRLALKNHASAIEEGKADVVGLFMVKQLLDKGIITEGTIEEYYTTFMASIFRSIRFGASSAHGQANMIRFNYFKEKEAFTRTKEGLYQINIENMTKAISGLSYQILTLQGYGNYPAVDELIKKYSPIKAELAADLQKLTDKNIPVDITFTQGIKTLNL